MSYATWQEALAAIVYEAALAENSELGRLSRAATRLASDDPWASGSPNSSGTVGAPGPSMSDSETQDPPRSDVSSTPEDGSNTYQGRISGISLRSRGDVADGFTLTVSFDWRTGQRLVESLSGDRGIRGTDGAEYSLTIVREALPTT